MQIDRPTAPGSKRLGHRVSEADGIEEGGRCPVRDTGRRRPRHGAPDDSNALGSYVIKASSLGAEVVLASGKKAAGESRTPWDLALDAVEGDRRAHRLWRTYERAMHRQRVVTGIGEFVTLTNGLPVQLTAEGGEAPRADDDRELVCDLTREEWRAIGGWYDGRSRIGEALAEASRGNEAFIRWFEHEFGTAPLYGEGGGWSGPPPPYVIDGGWWDARPMAAPSGRREPRDRVAPSGAGAGRPVQAARALIEGAPRGAQ